MRLIDADELMKGHCYIGFNIAPDSTPEEIVELTLDKAVETFKNRISMMPTAYDIEKVVKQISELEDWDIAGDINAVDKLIAEYDVIDIVRKGGVE